MFTFAPGTAAGDLVAERLPPGHRLAQPSDDGGLGPGTVVTSALFLLIILALWCARRSPARK